MSLSNAIQLKRIYLNEGVKTTHIGVGRTSDFATLLIKVKKKTDRELKTLTCSVSEYVELCSSLSNVYASVVWQNI